MEHAKIDGRRTVCRGRGDDGGQEVEISGDDCGLVLGALLFLHRRRVQHDAQGIIHFQWVKRQGLGSGLFTHSLVKTIGDSVLSEIIILKIFSFLGK